MIASLDAKTGELRWKKFAVLAPGEPGSETWKDKVNAWQSGGGAFVTGSLTRRQHDLLGSGNPVPGYDSTYRPGDNLYTNSLLAIDAATGKFNWHFQYTPNDNRDYDETGYHPGSTPRSMEKIARSSPTPAAMASTIRSIG